MLRRKFILCLAFLGFVSASFAEIIDAGVVSQKTDVNVPIYRVAIKSSSPEVKKLAERAFSVHGSYKLSDTQSAQFSFAFENTGTNAVEVNINDGNFKQVVSGENSFDALMRACDLAVSKTLGGSGFFAGKIAFVSDNTGATEIYVGDLFFNSVRPITNDKARSILPQWNHDGSKVFYTGYFRSGFMDLYECDLVNKTRRSFASYKGTNTGGVTSPDGKKVAMLLTTTGNAEIWISDASGKNVRKVTNTSAVESSVSWAPDSSTIVFASDAKGNPQIYKMNINGGKPIRVPTNISGYCSEPQINPYNTNQIIFTAAVNRAFQIALYDAKKGSSEILTTSGRNSQPKWCSDGRHVIFTKENGSKKNLWILDTATKKETLLHSPKIGNCSEASFIYLKK